MTDDDHVPVLLAGARTPFGRFRGELAPLTGVDLGAHAIRHAVARSGVPVTAIDAVVMGQVVQAGARQGPARQASIGAGISYDVPTVTINKLCLSGLTAIIDAARLIRLGEASYVVAGGQESMTNAPHLMLRSREAFALGDRPLIDSLNWDALLDPFDGRVMGLATDDGNTARSIGRAAQDAFAARSHHLAETARAAGVLAEEIAPIDVPGRRGAATTVTDDAGIRPDTTVEVLAGLRPAFSPTGTITAGSSSPLTDGAAAVVVASKAAARAAGLEWIAELGSPGQVAGPDGSLHSQPSRAIAQAAGRQGVDPHDFDLVEINEAFASVVLQSTADLGLDPDRVNTRGGAIALGHPVGASGARLALSLALALRRRGGGLGVVALCGGGGQGEALVLRCD